MTMIGKVLLALLAALPLVAQNHLTATATERYFNVVRSNLEESAEAMPAEKYGFRLTQGQMSFAEWLIHAVQRNYRDCAVLKAESTPDAEKQAASLKEKLQVSQALKDSFAYCSEALRQTTDQKAISSPEMSYAFLHLVVHNNEIYGNVVGYLRVSGILPPSTARRQNRAKP
jgi:hypothetical protein